MTIRGVFFDLGGTLYSYRNLKRALAPLVLEAAERLGSDISDRKHIGRAYTDAGQAVAEIYAERSYYLHNDYFRDTFDQFARRLDCAVNDDVWQWFADIKTLLIAINIYILLMGKYHVFSVFGITMEFK